MQKKLSLNKNVISTLEKLNIFNCVRIYCTTYLHYTYLSQSMFLVSIRHYYPMILGTLKVEAKNIAHIGTLCMVLYSCNIVCTIKRGPNCILWLQPQ